MPLPWPFSKQGARGSSRASFEPLQPLDPEEFEDNDASISLNLTDKLIEAIAFISVENGDSRQDVIRSVLFEHTYGAAALFQLIKWCDEQAYADSRALAMVAEPEERPRTRRNPDYDTMGKANTDFKLHLPGRMRTDLEELARQSGVNLAGYCRSVLVVSLLGARGSARWPSAPDGGACIPSQNSM